MTEELAKELAALDAGLREQGLSLALLLTHVAKQSFGVEVTLPKVEG